MLDLRPAHRDRFWAALTPLVPALGPALTKAPTGSPLAFLRDSFRIATGQLRKALARPVLSWRKHADDRRIEHAFHDSGATTELADAALAGENTQELAARIAKIARSHARSAGAAVYLRGPAGVLQLGADGAPCDSGPVERALESGRVEWSSNAAAVPLAVADQLVGALSLCFDGPVRDLRHLAPLLARAGAVLAAAEREARKDRFLSLAAHELKTPLTSIKGFSYSLARRLERGEPSDPRHVQVLERQAERLHSLLEEMLEVSRIETGRFVLHQEPCELAELVEAARRSLRRLGAEGGVTVRVEPALPLVADRERIERALSAMVLNARAHGPVVIDGVRNGGRADLRVTWTGEPLADPQHALEPRWEAAQVHRQGLGMALAIGRRAADLHGGSLHAEPHAFVLDLPLRGHLRASGEAGEGRVLVVDDDEPMARMMAEFLAEHGFVTDWAGSGRSALAKVKASPPEVLVLDLRMPEMDGHQILLAVRGMGLSPSVVLFSADRAVADAARELSCDGFVEKPFAPESLLAAVRRAMAKEPASADLRGR